VWLFCRTRCACSPGGQQIKGDVSAGLPRGPGLALCGLLLLHPCVESDKMWFIPGLRIVDIGMENNSEMNASRQGLWTQPAPQQGVSASRSLTATGDEALQVCCHMPLCACLSVSPSPGGRRINEQNRSGEPAVHHVLAVVFLPASVLFTPNCAGGRLRQICSTSPPRFLESVLASRQPALAGHGGQEIFPGRGVPQVRRDGSAGTGPLTRLFLYLWKGAAG